MSVDSSNPERAFFQKADASGKPSGGKVTVHFNPNSLQYTITNTLKNEGQGKKAAQHVSESTGKLTMDLVYDTTDTGTDVRTHTQKIAAFMKPDAKKAPAVVRFEWGTFIFTGMIESYKETLDFFAPVGVPLRASINLTLSSRDKVFELEQKSEKDLPQFTSQGKLSLGAIEVPTRSAAAAASQSGDPDAARALAEANGLESMRFPSGASLTVDAAVTLGGPVAFASGGAGLSLGMGGGIGIGGGASFGMSAGFSASASSSSPSFSFGGSVSAGIPATQGAFAGLRVSTSTARSSRIDTDKLIQSSAAVGVATDSNATFTIGGQANIEGSASLRADVGAQASLQARLTFD